MGFCGLAVVVVTLSLPMAGAPPMSAAEVGTLEDQLSVDAEDLDARARLLEFYFVTGDLGEWLRHEVWLVEHHPGSDLHRVAVGLKAEWVERLAGAWGKRPVAGPVLMVRVDPVYPAIGPGVRPGVRVSGVVKLRVGIEQTGRVRSLELISGHPLLVGAAMKAVGQWRYRPMVGDGAVVEVALAVRP
ncbi:MAG TPA: energy transducer TonB [Paludibaculum sp.]|jgi:hypothetical protein